jgi:hypothetical protein
MSKLCANDPSRWKLLISKQFKSWNAAASALRLCKIGRFGRLSVPLTASHPSPIFAVCQPNWLN